MGLDGGLRNIQPVGNLFFLQALGQYGQHKIFGTLSMPLNFVVAFTVLKLTKEAPDHIRELVESLRYPKDAGQAKDH